VRTHKREDYQTILLLSYFFSFIPWRFLFIFLFLSKYFCIIYWLSFVECVWGALFLLHFLLACSEWHHVTKNKKKFYHHNAFCFVLKLPGMMCKNSIFFCFTFLEIERVLFYKKIIKEKSFFFIYSWFCLRVCQVYIIDSPWSFSLSGTHGSSYYIINRKKVKTVFCVGEINNQ
jgi:hypothetical protein